MGGDDEFFCLANPVWLYFSRAMIYHAVFKHDVKPCAFAFLLTCVYYVNDPLRKIFLTFAVVGFTFFFAAKLIIASFLIETEY